ncbi:MAG TPA: DUF1629 domain-containing protein [Allosphingosinicella sp.]
MEARLREIRLEDETPDGGRAFRYNRQSATSMGRRIRTDNAPTKMIWQGPAGSVVPDFEDSYFLDISERARALIEQIEPGVHQFLPLDYVDRRGTLLEKRYMFVICNRIDSVDHARTTMILWRGVSWEPARSLMNDFPDDVPAGFDVTQEAKLVFSEAKSKGCHVWIDKHLALAHLMSDEMAEAIRSAGLNGVELSQRESI